MVLECFYKYVTWNVGFFCFIYCWISVILKYILSFPRTSRGGLSLSPGSALPLVKISLTLQSAGKPGDGGATARRHSHTLNMARQPGVGGATTRKHSHSLLQQRHSQDKSGPNFYLLLKQNFLLTLRLKLRTSLRKWDSWGKIHRIPTQSHLLPNWAPTNHAYRFCWHINFFLPENEKKGIFKLPLYKIYTSYFFHPSPGPLFFLLFFYLILYIPIIEQESSIRKCSIYSAKADLSPTWFKNSLTFYFMMKD